MIRAAGGNDDHPDSVKFSLIYKLMSAYSLLKPPKGSNISETESFETFCRAMRDNDQHVLGSLTQELPPEVKKRLMLKFDEGVSNGSIDFNDPIYENITNEEQFILQYVCGYIVRRSSSFTSCNECIACLTGEKANENNLIEIRDKFDVLFTPSNILLALIESLEVIILGEVKTNKLHPDTFLAISAKIDENALIPVGCSEHSDCLTSQITQFYLIMRMNFICRVARKGLKCSEEARKHTRNKQS